jgi:outer membrane protein assembly factor BamA
MWGALALLTWLTLAGACLPMNLEASSCGESIEADTRAGPAEHITEIRIQGNYRTPPDEIQRLAGVQVGDAIQDETLRSIQKRLLDTGRFDDVVVEKRWRTIEPGEDVVVVILVQEHRSGSAGVLGRAMQALGNPMILPVLDYEDGYGLSYGARLSPPDLLGKSTHVSVPLTWGGTRQAAVDITRRFDGGPLTSIAGGVSIRERENPYYREEDTRRTVSARVQRSLGSWFRTGASADWNDVEFAGVHQRFVAWGADVAFDTRRSVTFPRDSIYLLAGWERLNIDTAPDVSRYRTEARAYIGLAGPTVLAFHALRAAASGPLPPYEQYLLGGPSSVRGFRTGYEAGDALVAGSVELRIPLTSPLSFGSAGARAFADSGAVYHAGERLSGAVFRTGIGGGVFFSASLFTVNLDVARGLDSGYRVHGMGGLRF